MNNRSFTLIELLVVIVIIGILAGVIMISTSSSINKANFAKAQAFSKTVQNELLLNLVSEWTFDSSSTSLEDTWGNNNGSFAGTSIPEYQSSSTNNCVFGGCFIFNGTNGRINCGNIFNEEGIKYNMTASVWFKTSNATQTEAYIISKKQYSTDNRAFGIYITNQNVYWNIYNDSNASVDQPASFNAGEWIYVVGVWESGLQKIYLNGMLVLYQNRTFSKINDSTSIFMINAVDNGVSGFFDGLIDDVRIYNSALSSAQVKQDYIAGLDSLMSKNLISKQDYNQRIESLGLK